MYGYTYTFDVSQISSKICRVMMDEKFFCNLYLEKNGVFIAYNNYTERDGLSAQGAVSALVRTIV